MFAAVAVVVGVVSIIVAFWQEGAWGTRKRRGSGAEESRCPVPPACHFPSRPLDRRAGGWITRTAENSGEHPVTRGMQASVLHWRGGAAGSGGARLPRGEKQSGTPQDEPTDICASVSLPENEMMTAAPTLQGDGRVCLFAVPGRALAHQLGPLSPGSEGQGRDGQRLRPPAAPAPLALPRRAAQPGGWGWGADAQLLRGISLVPGSQLSLLDRRAALWSGKNPLRFLKQSSRHNHLIVRVFTCWAGLPPPPPTSGLAQVGAGCACQVSQVPAASLSWWMTHSRQTPQMISGDALSTAFSHKLIWPLLAHPSSQVTFMSLSLALPFSCLKSPAAPSALRMASRPSDAAEAAASRRLPV